MSLSLTQMREKKPRQNVETTLTICLAQDLISKTRDLQDEAQELQMERAQYDTPRDDAGEPTGPPKRVGDGPSPRVGEIDARLDEIRTELGALGDEMREYEGRLTLRAIPMGEWRRWADEHPARRSGDDNFEPFDQAVTYGWCDGTALIDRLGDFMAAWNGEAIAAEDRAYLLDNLASGDLKMIAQNVVTMHEAAQTRAPKSQKPSSSTETDESV